MPQGHDRGLDIDKTSDIRYQAFKFHQRPLRLPHRDGNQTADALRPIGRRIKADPHLAAMAAQLASSIPRATKI